MKISSIAFQPDSKLPTKYTCDGEGVSPPLTIGEVPENTKSLALIVDDPDAPAGIWVHWVLFNIPPSTVEISENSVPQNSMQGVTSYGDNKYGSPCPPSGVHRYFFKLYALDIMLDLPASTTAQDLEKTMDGHILDQAELMATYNR